ncbi:hypothetical protein [Streptomyces resistomycificus]|uniref:Uncharacterized protein n=1 Tax=Streptomyces resistomycificus TaxID=67356 RepID=A0A0L8LUA4_9ACTN|nr:hypothetical protein [Streptomyces resistomycificus]KOG41731.1 hypothetical protein ADK37_06450 [Streptomyces resistomycificus]KUN95843.1 hypothetical protein AQJ84_21945 [Streptomyces resistomycificus]
MTDGIAWLAAPESVACGGYGVVIARDLASDTLAARVAATVSGPRRETKSIGELTGTQVRDLLEGLFGDVHDGIALRHGEIDEWAYVVKYGGWQGEFARTPSVSRGGADVFLLEYEELNGKPVPPHFTYLHDERLMCALNLHLDHSWAYGEAHGDLEVAPAVQERLTAAGLPDETLERRVVHRAALEVLQRHFGLTLPRRPVLEETLPTMLLQQL